MSANRSAATIRHPGLGRLVGGPVTETLADGRVTINWHGYAVQGRPLAPEEIRAIEREGTNEPGAAAGSEDHHG